MASLRWYLDYSDCFSSQKCYFNLRADLQDKFNKKSFYSSHQPLLLFQLFRIRGTDYGAFRLLTFFCYFWTSSSLFDTLYLFSSGSFSAFPVSSRDPSLAFEQYYLKVFITDWIKLVDTFPFSKSNLPFSICIFLLYRSQVNVIY